MCCSMHCDNTPTEHQLSPDHRLGELLFLAEHRPSPRAAKERATRKAEKHREPAQVKMQPFTL